jgi:hypothetical protein
METVCPMIYEKDQTFQTSGWLIRILLLVLTAFFAIPAALIVRLVLPFEITWYSWTRIEIQRSRPSHQERASMRIASQIPPSVHFVVSLNLLGNMSNQLTKLRFHDRL